VLQSVCTDAHLFVGLLESRFEHREAVGSFVLSYVLAKFVVELKVDKNRDDIFKNDLRFKAIAQHLLDRTLTVTDVRQDLLQELVQPVRQSLLENFI
jgi:hypothetical protein